MGAEEGRKDKQTMPRSFKIKTAGREESNRLWGYMRWGEQMSANYCQGVKSSLNLFL